MCVKHESLSLSSAWREFGGLSMWWVTTKQLLLGFAGFDLHDQTQLRSNWKLVAKLATVFMSVRISMLSAFKLNKLFSVLEISFILNYPHICAFFVIVEDFVPSNSEQANFSRTYFH